MPLPALPFVVPAIIKKYWPYAAICLAGALLLTLAYCQGKDHGKTGEQLGQAQREVKVQAEVGKANTKAADKRVADTLRIALNDKELKDALASETNPDRRRALRGCIVMRQQGRDTSGIPGCSRPEGGPGTAVP